MGIYLPNIEMPKDKEMLCVNIYPDGKVCISLDLECKRIATAVAVPPHGRLVDADALDIYRREEQAYNEYKICPEEYFEGVASGLHEAAKCISTAPTIIPAEEEA